MTYEVQEDRGFAIVLLTGDVDLSCSPDARKTILDCLNSSQNTLVNLSDVSYIDSSGVASLVEGYQTAKKKNLRFGLIGVSSPAMSVLELARLDKVFPIYADIEECLKGDVTRMRVDYAVRSTILDESQSRLLSNLGTTSR